MKFFGNNVFYDIATTAVITSLVTAFMTMSFVKSTIHKGAVLSAESEHRTTTPTRKPERSPTPTIRKYELFMKAKLSGTDTPKITGKISITPVKECNGDASSISKGRRLETDATLKKTDSTKSKPKHLVICRISSTAVLLKWDQPVGLDLPIRYKVYSKVAGGKAEYRTSAYATTVQSPVVAGKEYSYNVTALYKTGQNETDIVESAIE